MEDERLKKFFSLLGCAVADYCSGSLAMREKEGIAEARTDERRPSSVEVTSVEERREVPRVLLRDEERS